MAKVRDGSIGATSARKAGPAAPFILVADDYEDNREMYAEYLRFAGYQVVTAADGADALVKIFARPPDVIVLDLSLPKVDGWAVARTVKADPRTRTIPIVAVTGHALKGAERDARSAGADTFLIKPCLPEDLLAAVKTHVDQRRSA